MDNHVYDFTAHGGENVAMVQARLRWVVESYMPKITLFEDELVLWISHGGTTKELFWMYNRAKLPKKIPHGAIYRFSY